MYDQFSPSLPVTSDANLSAKQPNVRWRYIVYFRMIQGRSIWLSGFAFWLWAIGQCSYLPYLVELSKKGGLVGRWVWFTVCLSSLRPTLMACTNRLKHWWYSLDKIYFVIVVNAMSNSVLNLFEVMVSPLENVEEHIHNAHTTHILYIPTVQV